MDLHCTVCRETLEQPGGLLFSPPVAGSCQKEHLCRDCYALISNIITKIRDHGQAAVVHSG